MKTHVPGIARGLVRIHVNKSEGLKKYMRLARTRGDQIAVVQAYINKNPNFARLVANAGMTVQTVANLLNDRV